MQRRKFIKQTAFAIPALTILPSFFSACKKDTLPKVDWSGNVLIIGAGASGLYAAQKLLEQGVKNISILEASDRWGGRVKSLDNFSDFAIELGAEEIHGNKSRWYDLVNDTNANIIDESGNDFYFLDGILKNEADVSSDNDVQQAYQIINSVSYYTGTDIKVSDYINQLGLAQRVKHIVNALLGNEYGTSNDRLSMKGISIADQLWNAGDNNYAVSNRSYKSIFQEVFANAISKVQLDTQIININYTGSQIICTDQNGIIYTADKVIITVPITILQQNIIAFTPSLPANKVDAINRIGMGAGMKINLKFSTPFWNSNLGSLYASGLVPEYWAPGLGKSNENNILTAFIMGLNAEILSAQGTNAITTTLQDLDSIYGNNVATNQYLDSYIQDWSKEPFIKGAYSFPKEATNEIRITLAEPIEDKIFFAGEAANTEGSFATVHGAIDAAYVAVEKLLESVE